MVKKCIRVKNTIRTRIQEYWYGSRFTITVHFKGSLLYEKYRTLYELTEHNRIALILDYLYTENFLNGR